MVTTQDADTAETVDEVRRWLLAVDALTEAVNAAQSLPVILEQVAATARLLLGFDFCAVLLPDELGRNLVITGWSGLSADYVARVNADRPVRLTVDHTEQAPSSKAFKGARPVTISDIAAEPEFTPWGGVAREQGYRAMVSVPLIAGATVVGTLNGYHAAVHDFTRHEIDRLTLLANHAAIALTSARMVEELQSLNDSLRQQRDLLTKSAQIHQQLLAVAVRGAGLAGIVQVLAELVSRPVLVDDARGTVLAQLGAPEFLQDKDFRQANRPDPDIAGAFAVTGPNASSAVVWTVRLADEMVARVWLPGVLSELSPIDERAVEHASIVVSLEILRLRTAVEVEHRLRGELLADILVGAATDSVSLRERADRLGHDLSVPHVAIVGRLATEDPARRSTAYQRALTSVADFGTGTVPRPLVAMHRGLIVGLWPLARANSPGGAAEQSGMTPIAAGVRKAIAAIPGITDATVALSGTGHRTYPQAYRTARGALDIAVRSGRRNSTVTLDDLGVSGLLLQLDDPEQLLQFADRTLSEIRRHDERRGTHLISTLRTYLDHRQSRSETATALHLHPNTVSQRLQRIQTLASLDLAEPSAIVQIRAALTVLDVAQGVAP